MGWGGGGGRPCETKRGPGQARWGGGQPARNLTPMAGTPSTPPCPHLYLEPHMSPTTPRRPHTPTQPGSRDGKHQRNSAAHTTRIYAYPIHCTERHLYNMCIIIIINSNNNNTVSKITTPVIRIIKGIHLDLDTWIGPGQIPIMCMRAYVYISSSWSNILAPAAVPAQKGLRSAHSIIRPVHYRLR